MPEAKEPYDLVVIGGGPAGYAAAIRAGQLGKRAACVEVERAGGTCLNWGCIPSKALLKAAELYLAIEHSGTFGITCTGVSFDFAKVMGRSREVADTMGGGIEFLFKKNKVDYLVGRGQVTLPGLVEVTSGEFEGKLLQARNILVATGCKARTLPGVEVDGERVMTSREALAMTRLPKSVTILGAGAIGVEFAYFLNAFGCEVTLVEMLDAAVPQEDAEVSRALEGAFQKQGITVLTGTRAENVRVLKRSVKLDLVKNEEPGTKNEEPGTKNEEPKTKNQKQQTPHQSESLLLAVGVVANTEGLFSPRVSPTLDRGYLCVDGRYETTVKGLYAAGDIIGPPWLAHVATFEAIQAVNGMFGAGEPERVAHFPACTYCQPQVASVGLTEQAAAGQGLDFKVGKFPFRASGKAVAADHPDGFVKVIIDSRYGEILGAHIIGAEATELIQEFNLAMKAEITADEIHHTIHAHPTLSEALAEAVGAAHGEAIHI